jgi:hypothetical protein
MRFFVADIRPGRHFPERRLSGVWISDGPPIFPVPCSDSFFQIMNQ